MGWVGLHGLMEENTKGNLRMVCLQVTASIYGLTAASMRAIIRKISKKDLELTPTPMVRSTKVNGKTGFNTAAEKSSNRLAKKMEVFGTRGKRRNG